MIFLLIGISAFILNKRERQKKKPVINVEKEFICLDCNKSFKNQVEIY
jgi:hypothetical protein